MSDKVSGHALTGFMAVSGKDHVIQAIGWGGAILILVAYFLTSFIGIRADGALSIGLNMTASAAIAMASWTRRAYQSVFVNVIWLLIGLFTLIKVMLRQ